MSITPTGTTPMQTPEQPKQTQNTGTNKPTDLKAKGVVNNLFSENSTTTNKEKISNINASEISQKELKTKNLKTHSRKILKD